MTAYEIISIIFMALGFLVSLGGLFIAFLTLLHHRKGKK